ncbi:hypothetical protein SAMD00019534_021680 [Acytostelium subglobosum LB1]|uniref:hypothetical protein n=1 Tax=Acytostelium subglobosum LB1 TaxID=1410327 RepID=UPI000644D614|nr:hypothetical protein SAMD00019534_021680 [Acytostelium subglobosum LB1]GAM18993.1 hypothetical protein SAMD00019534_021680 [Acytostelium subglobosum LB1]|eukprot:XP_012756920.1 hypothetical protein SAMD00019534_021680 [Acytostelium subglobosum LB1]
MSSATDNINTRVDKNDVQQHHSTVIDLDGIKEKLSRQQRKRTYQIEQFTSNHSLIVEQLVKRNMVENKKASNYHFKWGWSWNSLFVANEHQIVNHFPNYDEIGTKSGLTTNLNRLYRRSADKIVRQHIETFFPRSYLLSNQSERDSFLLDFYRPTTSQQQCSTSTNTQSLLSNNDDDVHFQSMDMSSTYVYAPQPHIDGTNNIWIAKPSSMARGVGIKIFNDANQLLQYTKEHEHQFIAQKYVESPLLVMNRKFDIRQFVLVTSLNPLTVFLYRDCYLRFCSVQYSTANIHDRFAHLTNHQVQKEYKGDHDIEIPHNQWSLETFKSYLKNNNHDRDIWNDMIYDKIKSLVITTLMSWPSEGHRNNSFELLGFDIMLTDHYQPLLIEVNSNPGLHLVTDVVKSHHPRAINDMFKVIMDNKDQWYSAADINDHDRKQQLFGDWDPIHVGHHDENLKTIQTKSKAKFKSLNVQTVSK